MRFNSHGFAVVAATCAALLGFSLSTATGQVVAHRDFDIEQFDRGVGGKDAVDKFAAAQEIVKFTNELRKEHDRGKLEMNKTLTKTAQDFAEYMARTDRYGHQADGREPAERVAANDYDYCLLAENIAQRYSSTAFETRALARGFVKIWIDSAEHRENMLDDAVTEIGVGVARSEKSGRYYAVQLLARPKSQAIELEIANQSGSEIEYELGEETFSLPPRMVRMHSRCRPPKLIVRLDEQKARTIDATTSRRYIVREGREGQLEIATDDADKAERS
jgi:uncharacterized protein YkwD